jgi:LemA protein
MLLWIILYAIIIFNSLVHTRQMANEAWSGIDVQLKRRSELVPNLVEAVKGYVGHERSVLEDVTRLRGAARSLPANDVTGRRCLVVGTRKACGPGGKLSISQGE